MTVKHVELKGIDIHFDIFLFDLLDRVAIDKKTKISGYKNNNGLKMCLITFDSYFDIFHLMELFKEWNFDISTTIYGEKKEYKLCQ